MCKRYEIEASEITQMVYDLSLKANRILPEGVKKIISTASDREKMPLAKQAFSDILENAKLAEEKSLPICQDCGLAVVFVEIGQDLCVKGGSIEDAINEGVRRAYIDGCLRKSVVKDPLFRRENSGDNTPAVIHWKVCSGSDIRSVVEAVKIAGPNPCPPIVLGIGIGGNFETVALAAKKALLKPEGVRHNIPEYAEIEREILKRVNALGIGPGGYGGMTTALDAHIETLPTHIAGMPVAVNICCHALRHAEGTIEGRILDD